jgi:hypothetical protein
MDEMIVYRTWDESMAEMALDLLRSEGLEARKTSDMTRSVYPFTMDGLGEIEILVPEDEAQEALEILAARFSEGDLTMIDDDEISESDFETDEYTEPSDSDENLYGSGEVGK